jgi:transcriptional repressor NF-X1
MVKRRASCIVRSRFCLSFDALCLKGGTLIVPFALYSECTLICGKQLSCGNHTCPARDHRGPCPPCLEASYEELICNCRRTVVYPPIPCGRTLSCTYPCARPAPLCGHPKQPHQCHESPNCPPCIFLVSKLCACGKSEVKNVRCSQERERVSCGKVCGRLLKCGGHRCEKGCHVEGECESPCTKPCGKPRKIWYVSVLSAR